MKITKKIFMLLLVVSIILIAIPSSISAKEFNGLLKDVSALTIEKLPGTVHEDGSYQFSEEEMDRLRALEKRKGDNITMFEILAICSPEYFSVLPQMAKKEMKAEAEIIGDSSIQRSTCNQGWIGGTGTSISKYGNSIRGLAYIDRMPQLSTHFLYVQNYVINSSNGAAVGYSHNGRYGPGYVQTTTIVDPLSGNYYSRGYFDFPLFCNIHGWVGYPTTVASGTISYHNPYA